MMQVSIMISGDSNQSNRCPLSSTNCAAPTAKASAMKPVKSNFLAVPFSWFPTEIAATKKHIIPSGTIIKKTQRQSVASAIIPPKIGPITGPMTPPIPHIINAIGWRRRGNVARIIPWPSGNKGAPKAPWPTRKKTKLSREVASPHKPEKIVNPVMLTKSKFRQPRV